MSAIWWWAPGVSIALYRMNVFFFRVSSINQETSGAIGMAAIGIALWKYVMRYAPHSPDYFNRDRFVLSNGN